MSRNVKCQMGGCSRLFMTSNGASNHYCLAIDRKRKPKAKPSPPKGRRKKREPTTSHKHPRGGKTDLVSMVFPLNLWKKRDAIAWAKSHSRPYTKIEKKADGWHLVQYDYKEMGYSGIRRKNITGKNPSTEKRSKIGFIYGIH